MDCSHIMVRIMLLTVMIALETCVPDEKRSPHETGNTRALDDIGMSDRTRQRLKQSTRALLSEIDRSGSDDELEAREIEAIIRSARTAIRDVRSAR